MELLGAYCLRDEECSGYAWTILSDTLEKTSDPRACVFWIGKTYADLGFFADSAEALGEQCSRFNDPDIVPVGYARCLLAEVIWWRDNAHRILWIPPAGDDSRYNRMMQMIDPSAPTVEDEMRRVRTENQKKRIAPYHPTLDPQLANLFNASIPTAKERTTHSIVDWSFLDQDDGQPGETADWVKMQTEMFEDTPEIVDELLRMRRWTHNIQPPSAPPRHDPNQPPFDPHDIWDGE